MSPMGDNHDRHQVVNSNVMKGKMMNSDSNTASNQLILNVNRFINEFRKHSFLSRTSGVAAKSFILLVDLLDKYYSTPVGKKNPTTGQVNSIADHDDKTRIIVKKAIVSFFLSFKANHLGQISAAEIPNNISEDDENNLKTFSHCCVIGSFLEPGCHAKEQGLGPYRTITGIPNNSNQCLVVGSPPSSSLPDALGEGVPSMSNMPKRSPVSPAILNLTQMFTVLLKVLEKDTEWELVKMVIDGLLHILSNYPSLICMTKPCGEHSVTTNLSDLTIASDIVAVVCRMIKNEDPSKRFPNDFQQMSSSHTTPGGTKKHKSDFDQNLYPLLEALVVYSSGVDPANQLAMLEVFKTGLTNRTIRHNIVHALTLCIMEMPEQRIMKILPHIVQHISVISATRQMAGPKMAFLSTLILFPKLYSSFTSDQFLCIFGTTIPYTNYSDKPSTDQGFDEFTTVMAHRVIALWFLHCKVHLRADLAKFIRTTLMTHFSQLSKDESNRDFRERTQSLGHQARRTLDLSHPQTPTFLSSSHHKNSQSHPHSPGFPLTPGPHSSSSNNHSVFFSDHVVSGDNSKNHHTFRSQNSSSTADDYRRVLQRELFESCMDLMARYTSCVCSSVPQKCPQADFLVDRSTAMTWVMGQQIITIATSNCTGKAVHQGYCSSCFQKIHSIPGVTTSMSSSGSSALEESDNEKTPGGTNNFDNIRKRHQSAIQPKTPTQQAKQRAFDDSHLENVISSSHQVMSSASNASLDGKEGPCKGLHQGWAEITIRRPTGKTCLLMRLENSLNLPCYCSSSCNNNSSVSMIDVLNPQLLQRTQSEVTSKSRNSIDYTAISHHRSSLSSKTLTDSINYQKSFVENISNTSSSCNSGTLDLNINESALNDSTSQSFRRTSSSPEIERQVLGPRVSYPVQQEFSVSTSTEDEVEEAREVKDDTSLSQSPSKGGSLMRTVSLGKADSPSKVTANNGSNASNLNRAASFKTSVGERKVSSPGLPGHQRIDEGSAITTPGISSRVGNKKNLQIDISLTTTSITGQTNGVKRTSFSQQGSPTKSSLSSEKSSHEYPSSDLTPSPIVSSSSNVDVSRSGNVTSNLRERSHTISGSTATTPSNNSPAVIMNNPFDGRSPKPLLKNQNSIPHVMNQGLQFNTNVDLHHHGNKSGGLTPSFVFLQLFYNPAFNDNFSEKAILLNKGPGLSTAEVERSLRNLDFITPYETHKIGVVYIAPGQEKDKIAILANKHGSHRYQNMLEGMATLVHLKDVNQQTCYIGGLDTSPNLIDGKFAYCWQDHLTQVVFHVATLMPKKETDPQCNFKNLHIGNDFVCIAYNDSGRHFERKTMAGQGHFLKVCIVITPLDCGINKVQVQTEEDVIRTLGQQSSFMISDSHLPLFVRQIAIHANLALDQKHKSNKIGGAPFVSNFVERLRTILRLKNKVINSASSEGETSTPSTPAVFSAPNSHHGSTTGDQIRARANTTVHRSDGVMSPIYPSQSGDTIEYPDDFTIRS